MYRNVKLIRALQFSSPKCERIVCKRSKKCVRSFEHPLHKRHTEETQLRATCPLKIEEGRFAATMKVSLVNEGPVTLMLDSRER